MLFTPAVLPESPRSGRRVPGIRPVPPVSSSTVPAVDDTVEPPVGGRRLPEFDGLRTVALLGALTSHAGLNRGGWIGVDVFFVLSGFLITSLLIRPGGTSDGPRMFFARRMRRLLPMILFVVAAVSGLLMLGLHPPALDPARAYPMTAPALGYVPHWFELGGGAS